jgi:hypothetical protein|tara:strand:+ start:3536 stop:3865 length:330 start_codon:yes stop_codon:yes gene_type:complete
MKGIEGLPQQSLEAVFLENKYRVGQVFELKNNDGHYLGCSTYSGEYAENCDGVVMKFNNGSQILSDFCRPVEIDCPEALWAVTKDIEQIENSAKEKVRQIIEEYQKIKE